MIRTVLAFLGFLSLFNLVAHIEALRDMVRSFTWLGEWWRYIVGVPFDLLNLNISRFDKDALSLVLVVLGASLRSMHHSFGGINTANEFDQAIELLEEESNKRGPLTSVVSFLFALSIGMLSVMVTWNIARAIIQKLPEDTRLFAAVILPLILVYWAFPKDSGKRKGFRAMIKAQPRVLLFSVVENNFGQLVIFGAGFVLLLLLAAFVEPFLDVWLQLDIRSFPSPPVDSEVS